MATKNMFVTKTSTTCVTFEVAVRTMPVMPVMPVMPTSSRTGSSWHASDAGVVAGLLVVDAAAFAGAGSYGPATDDNEWAPASTQQEMPLSTRRHTSKPGVATRIAGDPRSWSPPV